MTSSWAMPRWLTCRLSRSIFRSPISWWVFPILIWWRTRSILIRRRGRPILIRWWGCPILIRWCSILAIGLWWVSILTTRYWVWLILTIWGGVGRRCRAARAWWFSWVLGGGFLVPISTRRFWFRKWWIISSIIISSIWRSFRRCLIMRSIWRWRCWRRSTRIYSLFWPMSTWIWRLGSSLWLVISSTGCFCWFLAFSGACLCNFLRRFCWKGDCRFRIRGLSWLVFRIQHVTDSQRDHLGDLVGA